MERKRLLFIDYSKALAIIFVLFDHLGVVLFKEYILFAMPLFFIVSGYTFNLKNASFSGYTKARFKRLMIPFWGFMILDIPLEIARAYFYRYGTYKVAFPALINTIYGSGAKVPDLFGWGKIIKGYVPCELFLSRIHINTVLPTNCHLWFLPTMFCASILFFAAIKYLRKNNFALIVVSVILVFISALESNENMFQLPYGFGRGCICAAFMIFGYKLKEIAIFEKCGTPVKMSIFIICSVVTLIFIKVLRITGDGMIDSYYGSFGVWSAYITFAGGIFAAVAVLMLFNMLERIEIGAVGNVLSNIGQNTMGIFLCHFFVYFVLETVYFTITGKNASPDEYWMAVLPVSATWFKVVEAAVCVCVVLFIQRIRQKQETGFAKRIDNRI